MSVIPISSELYERLAEMAVSKRAIFMTGLPGVGKTLLIQQLALIAKDAGRKIHLIRWREGRAAFESAEILAKYPEVNGVTAPIVRRAVGAWARTAVAQWHMQNPAPEHLLIGEVPVIGNRLSELTQVQDDLVEPFLRSDAVQFVVPVPSWKVRAVIETARDTTIAAPRNDAERRDASPAVLRTLWQEVNLLARAIGLTKARPDSEYNPYIYAGVYEALLQHRNAQTILIDEVLRPQRSVYDLDVVTSELQATDAEVKTLINTLESEYHLAELEKLVENWHSTVTDTPSLPDPGPEMLIPLPDILHAEAATIDLSSEQVRALQDLLALPVEAPPAELGPKIDAAVALLQIETPEALANVHKFDVYDSYFNVKRTDQQSGIVFISGLLQAYRNVLDNLDVDHDLTQIELSLLRIALESALRVYGI